MSVEIENQLAPNDSPGFASRFADMVESRKTSLLIVFCLFYLSIACFLASQKLFWNDELYTLYFSRLNWSDLWWALGTGADQIPPTFIILTKAASKIFGINQISVRLPEIMGFLLLSICLYRIQSIRISAAAGFLAMLLPTMMPAFSYAYEARPYALVLGFGSLALLCWLSGIEKKPRKLQMIGLGVSLSGAFLSHYSGILLFIPLILGELIRIRSLKKIDYPVWITFILALLPMILFLPLLRASAAYGTGFWAKPDWGDIFLFYDYLVGPSAVFLVFVVLFSVVLWTFIPQRESGDIPSFRSYEFAAILGFVAISPIAVIASKLLTGALTGRHALLSVIGFALLLSHGIHSWLGRKKIATFVLPFFFAGFLGMALANWYECQEDSASYHRTVEFLKTNAGTEFPIVSWFVHPAQQVWYYGPTDISSRLFYLADAEASLRYLGHDTIDRGLLNLKPWFPLKNVQSYERFTQTQRPFLLYYCSWEEDWRWNWIVSKLLADHFRIEMKRRQGDQYLFLVTAD